MPKISVIIPAYNAQYLLPMTLRSVLAQTYRDWEAVIVDDGSSDQTFSVAQTYAAQDSRLRVVSQNNTGLPGARNFGYRMADPTTEYVIFLDSDDTWLPDALTLLLRHLEERPDAAGVYGLGRYIDGHGDLIAPYTEDVAPRERWGLHRKALKGEQTVQLDIEQDTTFETLILDNCILTAGTLLLRRSVLTQVGLFDTDHHLGCPLTHEDWDLWLRIAVRWNLALLPAVVLNYRRHAGNLTNQTELMWARTLYVRYKMLRLPGLTPLRRKSAFYAYRQFTYFRQRERRHQLRRHSQKRWRFAFFFLLQKEWSKCRSYLRFGCARYVEYHQVKLAIYRGALPRPLPDLFASGVKSKSMTKPTKPSLTASENGQSAHGREVDREFDLPPRPSDALPNLQILTWEPLTDAAVRYRAHHLLEQWSRSRGDGSVYCLKDTGPFVLSGDLIVFHRTPMNSLVQKSIRAARERGALTLYSCDDLTFDLDVAMKSALQLSPAYFQSPDLAKEATKRWRQDAMLSEGHLATLKACHAALVSTQYLARKVCELGGRAILLRNALSERLEELSNRAYEARQHRPPVGDRVMLGYLSGSATHDHDFAEIAQIVAEIMSKERRVYLTVVGPLKLGRALAPFESRIRRLPFMPWQDLPSILAGIDINLAPLDMFALFNHAKSELKWLEAGAVGVPTIASATAGFAEAVHAGRDGILAKSLQEWYDGLIALIDQPELRGRLGEAARYRILAEYTAQARAAQAREAILGFCQEHDLVISREAGRDLPVIERPLHMY